MNKISRRSFIPLLGTAVAGASTLSFSITKELSDQEILFPSSLKKGDTIGVCAPAGGIKSNAEIADFKKVLNDLGYSVVFSKNIDKNTGYFSGTDQERAEDFMDLIQLENVKAIFFIRGGWGCARILEHLDFQLIRMNPERLEFSSNLVKCMYWDKPAYVRHCRAFSILLFFLSTSVIIVEILVIKSLPRSAGSTEIIF